MGIRRLNKNTNKPPVSFFLIMAVAAVIMFAIYIFVPIPKPINKYVLVLGIPVLSATGIFIQEKVLKK